MTATYETSADRLRAIFADMDDAEALHWAATAACGAIRDQLRAALDELDVLFEVLEARGIWDDGAEGA